MLNLTIEGLPGTNVMVGVTLYSHPFTFICDFVVRGVAAM